MFARGRPPIKTLCFAVHGIVEIVEFGLLQLIGFCDFSFAWL